MSAVIDELLNDLKSGDDADRRYAAEDLGDLGDPAAVPALVKALEDPVVAVREAAVESLIIIGGREVCKQVIPLLDSDAASVRNYAIEILEQIGPDAVEDLIAICDSPSSDMRKFAMDILGKIGELSDVDAFGAIASRLKDENINVAGAAAEALGRLGNPAAIPVLAELLDGEPWLQCNALNAIAQIGGKAARQVISDMDPERLAPEVKIYYDMARGMLGMDND
ncbi:MAG: HEAT repeat domain-containing protein [Deltaproteobacteria bacterium]|nr:HEAT repeat domain-containing protein [Deltaproteobacteria bacterium]MBW2030875.1 HEAT repeat domain-containing protein [Deltaproteobacteria bacterium]